MTCKTIYRRLLDKLKKNHKLIVISTRRYERSEIEHKPLTFEQKVDDVLAVLDDAKIFTPHLM